ncbi:MAG: TonB-dependent outer membrane protein SusC/RagA [Gemmatimonadetes bacterium]|nr:TonB-dependent outer membrane protein SusC/RagA [Gemmatimonadota bacterium]
MMRRLRGLTSRSLLLLGFLPVTLAAQEAVTITGHVSSARMPVRGATVRIDQLDLGAVTDAEGRYSFIVPSTRVRGQTVPLTARYVRLRPQSVDVTLTGGSLVRDFDLVGGDGTQPAPSDRPRVTDPARNPDPVSARPRPTSPSSAAVIVALDTRVMPTAFAPRVDSTVLQDIAGPSNLASALTGRFAGVEVLNSSALGGTSALFVRGPKTIAGVTQPLIVVNGILVGNDNVTNLTQLSGGGGFDYGSAINDLNLDDIASVELLRGPVAALRYGGRAANGVLVVTTKNGRGLNGIVVSANQQISSASVLRSPSYQDTFGQGLGGAFSFFDGKGGGVNDAVDQSWGPIMASQPVPQASFTEAGRAEVRPFNAFPSNVSGYFVSNKTLTTNVAMQGGNETGQFRIGINNRSAGGLTPQSHVTTRSLSVTGGIQPSSRLIVSGDLQLYTDRGEDRPGSGFDESNNVSVFSHMPRQVDVLTYQTRLRDATLKQVSWNYAGHNNPYFAVLENDNHDDRSRWLAGGSASYALSDWITATARAGTDHLSDKRSLTVAGGWMGGFPYYLGRGDFSTGGFQNDDIRSSHTNGELFLRMAPRATGSTAYAFTVGLGRRADDLSSTILGADKLVDTTTRLPLKFDGSSATNVLFGGIEASVRDFISLSASARGESSQIFGFTSSTVYPAVLGSVDLMRADSGSVRGKVESFVLRAGFSRSGNEATGEVLQRLGLSSSAASATLGQVTSPETTTGFEGGATVRMLRNRVGLDVTYYSEKSENLVFGSGTTFLHTGALTNKGIEASVSLTPLRASGLEWSVGANLGRNENSVDAISGGAGSIALGPTSGGVSVEARPGSPLGALVGLRFLRDAGGQLVLRNGAPLADSAAGARVLGQSLPSWTGGLSSSIRRGGFEVSVLFDTHRGGQLFSASNRAGAVSGTLAETVFRPDSGLLISGVDIATGQPNAVHVSTENYYHALGAIGERWIYDASFVKLREARVSFSLPLHFIPVLQAQSVRLSIVGRNLALWADAPNIDPETVLSTATYRGAEMGQLPTAKSVGFQVSLTP